MTGAEHDGQHERDERVERGHQQIHGDEFHGTGEDERAHAHGPQERKAARAHQHAVRQRQKEKADADRRRPRQCRSERLAHDGVPVLRPHH